MPAPGVPSPARAASLRRLYELARTVNGDLDLNRTLQSVCQGVVDGLGFGVAVLNLVTSEGDLHVVAVAGDERAAQELLGTRASRAVWESLLAACEPVGELLVDYLHRVPEDAQVPSWIPDRPVPDDPGAWHPLDQLLAPLRTARSGLLGVISVDLPLDGRRPSPDQLELLEMYAAQASVALENAQLHAAVLARHEEGAEALSRLSALVNGTPVAIVELDLDGLVRLWNPAAEAMFGWPAAEVLGRRNPIVDEDTYRANLDVLEHQPLVGVPSRRRRRDGSFVQTERSSALLRDDAGRPFGYLGVYVDTTDRTLLEEGLRAAAHTDPLTGLANRTLFGQRLEKVCGAGGGATVLLLDLDGFKGVNDTAGHAAGDLVLIEVARRTETACRTADLVARLGGDEFVVLMAKDHDDEQAAAALARRLVEALALPIQVGLATVSLGASVGVARLQGVGSADDLLRDADVAMYAAKADGKGRYRVFEPQLRATLLDRTALVQDLRAALRVEDELFVRWHPMVRVADAQLLGFEALVRWQHPGRGELAPAAFIGLAEESGLVVDVGRLVLHRACSSLRRWQQAVPEAEHTSISVNLSPVQLGADIVATVQEVLLDTGVNPQQLVLELTEDVLLHDVDTAVGVLRELRALGVRLAIDDFGAGYSSLAYLKRLPVDVVKLDRSLLQGVETDLAALALFDAVVGLVRRLGLTGVAEGVETPGQWRLLERLRCPVAQGFLLARPLLEQDVPRWVRVGRPSSGLRAAG